MRAAFVFGLILLLLAAGGTATLAARSVPCQGLQATLPADALAAPGQLAAPPASLPTPATSGEGLALWLAAALLVAMAVVLAALALRTGPQAGPAPAVAGAGRQAVYGSWRAFVIVVLLAALVAAALLALWLARGGPQRPASDSLRPAAPQVALQPMAAPARPAALLRSAPRRAQEITPVPGRITAGRWVRGDVPIGLVLAPAEVYTSLGGGAEVLGYVALGERVSLLAGADGFEWLVIEAGGARGWVTGEAVSLPLSQLLQLLPLIPLVPPDTPLDPAVDTGALRATAQVVNGTSVALTATAVRGSAPTAVPVFTPGAPAPADGPIAVVIADSDVYATPQDVSSVRASVAAGERVRLLARSRDMGWLIVETERAEQGWVSGDALVLPLAQVRELANVPLAPLDIVAVPTFTPAPPEATDEGLEPTAIPNPNDGIPLAVLGPGEVYGAPDAAAGVLDGIAPGEEVLAFVRTPDGAWIGVTTARGVDGWVRRELLDLSDDLLAQLRIYRETGTIDGPGDETATAQAQLGTATAQADARSQTAAAQTAEAQVQGDEPRQTAAAQTAEAQGEEPPATDTAVPQVLPSTLPATEGPTAPPTATPEAQARTVIRADWPGRLEVGESDTVTVRLLNEAVLPNLPTVAPDRTAQAASPVPVGTPDTSLPRAFGAAYTACATARLAAGDGLQARLVTDEGCLPIDVEQVEWTWQVTAAEAGAYAPLVQIDVTWTPADGGEPIRQTVWAETIHIPADAPLIPSRQLGTLSLASAGLGTVLTAPLLYRRRREAARSSPEVQIDMLASGDRGDVREPGAPSWPSPQVLIDMLASGDRGDVREPGELPWPSPQEPSQEPPDTQVAPGAAGERARPEPHLNTEFKGVGPDEPLPVGREVSLFVWVGEQIASGLSRGSRPFAFNFAGEQEPVTFVVQLDADPECWRIEAVQPEMVVAPSGTTDQAAVFRVTALTAGRDKLYLSVERADTRAVVQHVWLPVQAADPSAGEVRPAGAAAGAAMPDSIRRAVQLPLDAAGLRPREVRITVASGRDAESFTAVVDAELPGGHLHQIYTVPVSAMAVQNATLRLRQELERMVLFSVEDGGATYYPFADPYSLTVEPALAREAAVSLADAGQQVWQLLFQGPRAPEGLKQAVLALRDLPHGSELQVVIESQQFIVPWALLYDKPGEINAETLDWSGFWGYRYIMDVLPPGNYPEPTISDLPPGVGLLFHDDESLRRFTDEQERFVRRALGVQRIRIACGAAEVRRALAEAGDSTLLYVYCHGQHESGAVRPGALPSESALTFSRGDRVRLADMRRIVTGPLSGRPLVFLNACEGATQDAFYYDGFMPFFIEECGARGFIGTEVKAPQLLAHDFALRFLERFGEGRPVGEILWQLRRYYLEKHNNPLAFNYTLYGLDEVQLARPLLVGKTPEQ